MGQLGFILSPRRQLGMSSERWVRMGMGVKERKGEEGAFVVGVGRDLIS